MCRCKTNAQIKERWDFTTNKLGSCFSLKDKTPVPLLAGVVYKFKCGVDPQHTYIGKTIRHLGIRIREHRTATSAISDHRLECNCTCGVDDFEILDRCNDDYRWKASKSVTQQTIT